jgi:soluble lytic murein transglycosylase-like protein
MKVLAGLLPQQPPLVQSVTAAGRSSFAEYVAAGRAHALVHAPTRAEVAPPARPALELSVDFKRGVADVARRVGMKPSHLAAVMWFESRFGASARNPSSGAVGLVQLMPHNAARLVGAPPAEAGAKLARMSPEEQLPYVEAYLRLAVAGRRVDSLRDAYMAVFFPAAVGKGPDYVIARADDASAFGRAVYAQNAGLDVDHDGVITAREAAAAVESASSSPQLRALFAELDATPAAEASHPPGARVLA